MKRNALEKKLKEFNKLEVFMIDGDWVAQIKINGITKEGSGTTMERALNDLEDELNAISILPRKN